MSDNLPKILGIGVLMLGSMGVGGLLGSSGLTGQANGTVIDSGQITELIISDHEDLVIEDIATSDYEDKGESICRATSDYRMTLNGSASNEGICAEFLDQLSCIEDARCKWDYPCDYVGGEVWDGGLCIVCLEFPPNSAIWW